MTEVSICNRDHTGVHIVALSNREYDSFNKLLNRQNKNKIRTLQAYYKKKNDNTSPPIEKTNTKPAALTELGYAPPGYSVREKLIDIIS